MPVTINGTTGIATPDGSASVPPYTGSSGATNGLYFPSATSAAIATNGTNAVTIDSSQNVGIGTASPATYGKFVVYDAQNAGLYGVSTNTGGYSFVQITNTGAGGRSWQLATGGGVSAYGGNLGIYDATAGVVRLTLSGTTGNLTLNTADAGIVFNKTGALTNSTLNDYEVGTWTPVDASGAGLTISVVGATYVKIGSMVWVAAYFSYPSTASGATAQIGALPFTASSAGNYPIMAMRSTIGQSTSPVAQITPGTTVLTFFGTTNGSGLTNANLSLAGVLFNGCYQSAS